MRDAYPTPLTMVSTDIEQVGGEKAYIGMRREGADGKQYRLAKSGSSTVANKRQLMTYELTTGRTRLSVPNGRIDGVPAGLTAMSANQYFWIQVSGVAEKVYAPSATLGSLIVCATSAGQGASISNLVSVGDTTGGFTITNTGVAGMALTAADSDDLITLDVNPGMQWTGTGAGASVTTGDDA